MDYRRLMRPVLCMTVMAGCLVMFLACLGFDPQDPPGNKVLPPPDPPGNWLGHFGARLSHPMFYWFGPGCFVLLAGAATAAVLAYKQIAVRDAWLRVAGVLILAAVVGTISAKIAHEPDHALPAGKGGIIGIAAGAYVLGHFGAVGSVVVILTALGVGLALALDDVLARTPEFVRSMAAWKVQASPSAAWDKVAGWFRSPRSLLAGFGFGGGGAATGDPGGDTATMTEGRRGRMRDLDEAEPLSDSAVTDAAAVATATTTADAYAGRAADDDADIPVAETDPLRRRGTLPQVGTGSDGITVMASFRNRAPRRSDDSADFDALDDSGEFPARSSGTGSAGTTPGIASGNDDASRSRARDEGGAFSALENVPDRRAEDDRIDALFGGPPSPTTTIPEQPDPGPAATAPRPAEDVDEIITGSFAPRRRGNPMPVGSFGGPLPDMERGLFGDPDLPTDTAPSDPTTVPGGTDADRPAGRKSDAPAATGVSQTDFGAGVFGAEGSSIAEERRLDITVGEELDGRADGNADTVAGMSFVDDPAGTSGAMMLGGGVTAGLETAGAVAAASGLIAPTESSAPVVTDAGEGSDTSARPRRLGLRQLTPATSDSATVAAASPAGVAGTEETAPSAEARPSVGTTTTEPARTDTAPAAVVAAPSDAAATGTVIGGATSSVTAPSAATATGGPTGKSGALTFAQALGEFADLERQIAGLTDAGKSDDGARPEDKLRRDVEEMPASRVSAMSRITASPFRSGPTGSPETVTHEQGGFDAGGPDRPDGMPGAAARRGVPDLTVPVEAAPVADTGRTDEAKPSPTSGSAVADSLWSTGDDWLTGPVAGSAPKGLMSASEMSAVMAAVADATGVLARIVGPGGDQDPDPPDGPGGGQPSTSTHDAPDGSRPAGSILREPPTSVGDDGPFADGRSGGAARPGPARELPACELLDPAVHTDPAVWQAAARAQAAVLEKSLPEFGVDAKVVHIECGPVLTMFELDPAPGVKINKFTALESDLARALKCASARVVAPLPEKSTIGLEVPNARRETVRLRELLEGGAAASARMELPLCLGKDAAGRPLVADLAGMPHLLIAGTTGSGKSVCINSIILSLLMRRTADEVKLVLIDPKQVELAPFREVPHLLCPVIGDVKKAEAMLEWAVQKMEERYALLAEAGVRNIAGWNALGREQLLRRLSPADPKEAAAIPEKLPYMVIVIDELADLMIAGAKSVETHITRLAQKSRAVGIHLIVATQRPSVDVVTGLIKANLPCRISFRVAGRVDSRTILDQKGADLLLGHGDMLYLTPASANLIRAQGTFVSDAEVARVTGWLAARAPKTPDRQPADPLAGRDAAPADGGRDELFDAAVEVVLESGRGSVSLLQRRLAVGYSRAGRLIEQMAEAGIVGEFRGSAARDVLMTLPEWRALKISQGAGSNDPRTK